MKRTFYDQFPATSILLLACIVLYCLEAWFTQRAEEIGFLQALVSNDQTIPASMGANSFRFLRNGEIWRLIAHAFLHGGILHIAMNGMVLADLGRICEPQLGTERFTVTYIACAVAAGLASALYHGLVGLGAVPSVGASGALFGLIGLLFAFSLRHRDRDLRDQIVRWIIYIVLFSLVMPGGIRIDHAAHAGGFIAGSVFGYFTPRYITSDHARAWRIPLWITILLAAASVGIALWGFRNAMVR